MIRRSTRYYRRNEEQVMRSLGLEPTANSGAGWVQKEDGCSDIALAQLKSTDARSIRIDKKDMEILEAHAQQEGKCPVFVVQYLQDGSVYLVLRPEHLNYLADAIGGQAPVGTLYQSPAILDIGDVPSPCREPVGGSPVSRAEFYEEKEEERKARKDAKRSKGKR